ncbi:signal peptidase I [Carnobacteriaceae bacterium zg-84]|uniref:signal peptidase I n=1 Tax=Granulicatella sp. zg-84 TaxID=2678503 RepID=UPI0013BFEC07|nr:signal peptidase I [Granulicatella sp. zg-84]NEW66428.1 signal peptidase I [Granulicatella sp. zg-84]QMI86367.1 signal peptidase I [Carnobacteriaceae bacterium zg-84]
MSEEVVLRNKKKKKKSANRLKENILFVLYILGALALAMVLKAYVITSMSIVGHSMSPTLETGQTVVVYKLGKPKRFDIVTLKAPDGAMENGQRKVYIKRVIGLPGDEVEYKNDTLYINGKPYDEPYLANLRQSLGEGQTLEPDRTLKQILDSVKLTNSTLPEENTTLVQNEQGKYVIPENHYFVLGDNRLNSKDGDEFGLANANLLEGTAIFRFMPLDKIGPLK